MKFEKYEKILDRYRIEDILGKGGFGEVYLARHMELNIYRAIKVLHRGGLGMTDKIFQSYQNRFRVEAVFGAKLENPHIIRVYDFVSENNILYLIMEYAPGGDLSKFIKNHVAKNEHIPADQIKQIIRDIAFGITSIHELDGVHRDLKPANILFDKNQRAKIADLGILQLGEKDNNQTSSPVNGHPGTLAYMSPEQEHSQKRLTPASDIYSLGLIAFELFTLKVRKSLPANIHAAQFRTDIEPWLDNAIEKMLDPNPENRPRNGYEVLDILSPPKLNYPINNDAPSIRSFPLPYGLSLELVRVPNGPFIMGTDEPRLALTLSASPAHWVTLPDYWIGRYPVTIAQFAAFVRQTGYVTTAERNGEGFVHDRASRKFKPEKGVTWAAPYGPDKVIHIDPYRPVTMVSWLDAQMYCQWLTSILDINFRLPSEAEWEKAARGVDGRYWPWGGNPPNQSRCNCSEMEEDITPSNKYSPASDSPFGCCDMVGNIWEWTNSINISYPYSPSDGREIPPSGVDRILRGGSIIHFPSVVTRDKDPENACYYNDGFRIAATKI